MLPTSCQKLGIGSITIETGNISKAMSHQKLGNKNNSMSCQKPEARNKKEKSPTHCVRPKQELKQGLAHP